MWASDSVELTVELGKAVAMTQGLGFAIREGGRTVGAGTVVVSETCSAASDFRHAAEHIADGFRGLVAGVGCVGGE
jgi:hypothetical protein